MEKTKGLSGKTGQVCLIQKTVLFLLRLVAFFLDEDPSLYCIEFFLGSVYNWLSIQTFLVSY